MTTKYATDYLNGPPEDPRLLDQEYIEGVDWLVRQEASCHDEDKIVWEENTIIGIAYTQGDAIDQAWSLACDWDKKGIALKNHGKGGTWRGTDGETRVRIFVEKHLVEFWNIVENEKQ